MYANVIVDISYEKLDKTFQYAVPKELEGKIREGMAVRVPFGKGDRLIEAYVVEITETSEFDEDRIKNIVGIVEKKIDIEGKMISLANYIRRNYGGTMNRALKTVVPVKEQVAEKEKKTLSLLLTGEELENCLATYKKKHAVARLRLLEGIIKYKELPYEIATGELKVPANVINELDNAGIINISREQIYRNPFVGDESFDESPKLNEKQQEIVDSIREDFMVGLRKTYLIRGITGSGKTEVYLNVIDTVLNSGKQVIMLIPEISLTFQTVRRFYKRFGNRVAIINSKLSKGEKYDQMMRAKRGEVSIVIGPRSALFTPFQNLGLIVIDEEHEGTYKSESVPRYHAREVALELARLNDASVILGSATPSLESYYKAEQGQYKLFTLDIRAKEDSVLSKVYVEDMREELKSGNKSMFSNRLKKLMQDRFEKGQQMMLFINRRGYSNFVSCRMCGEVVKCSHCDVSMKFHNNNTLVCHYCGSREDVPAVCPKCGSKYIAKFGTGTQKVEEAVSKMFPQARVLRMDYDTTTKKEDYEKILETFSKGEADVLIGTQMIVKGHDFPNVTLVGIIAADLSLYANDYRATERTFQLLTQAAGRAGRDNLLGEVVIQSYTPDNFSIRASAKQNYEEFYKQEMCYRKMLEYPPMSNMMVIRLSSGQAQLCEEAAQRLCDYTQLILEKGTRLIGPANATIYKVSDIFTNLVYIKDGDYNKLITYKDKIEEFVRDNATFKYVCVQFDFNPVNA